MPEKALLFFGEADGEGERNKESEEQALMSQEYDLNQPNPAQDGPATPPRFQSFSEGQPRVSDPYLPGVPTQRPAPVQPAPAALPEYPPQRARQERLQRLRQQRQQSERLPEIARYQRQGVPAPPPSQPSFKALLKHWWEHGPFASPTPRTPATSKPPAKIPVGMGEARPVEKRVRAWIARGQQELPLLLARVQKTVQQAKAQANTPSRKRPMRVPEDRMVPGMIVLGFAPEVSRDEAAQRIRELGGKPLRYKAAINQFQVAVPLGQEEAFVTYCRQAPDVIYADLERPGGR
jgi:hypothetical protein